MTRMLLLRAALCAFVVRTALRAGSLRFAVRAARAAGWLCRTRASVADCVQAASVAAARVAHPTCLYRALTTYALVVHRHRSAAFHLGAAVAGERRAHAWVTVAGRTLDPEAAGYAPLWTAQRHER